MTIDKVELKSALFYFLVGVIIFFFGMAFGALVTGAQIENALQQVRNEHVAR